MIDSPYLAKPGKKFKLSSHKTDDKGEFNDKEDAEPVTKKHLERLDQLQEVLYAGRQHAILVIFQAMDGGGKHGAIEHIFSGINPQGCGVTSFKKPSEVEARHDFLWREHLAVPEKGMIGIFNRSHYEAVLVERVHNLVPKKRWQARYEHINAFEKMLSDEGVTILKFFLHISKDEQRERLQARLDNQEKHWKFDPNDIEERKLWNEYQHAYEDVIAKCSTEWAPWYVVPADRKWFRNWVIGDTIVRTMEKLDLKFPAPVEGIRKYKIE